MAKVTLKYAPVIIPALVKADDGEWLRSKVDREYWRCAKRLKGIPLHPNVAEIDRLEVINNFLIIWCKYPGGRTLRELINERRREHCGHAFNEADTLSILLQLTQALAHLHGHEILHRNVIPENIYLLNDGRAVLAGFTLFGSVNSEQPSRSTDHGLDLYRPPELLSEENLFENSKGDVWRLGCVLYEMVMPEHPYRASNYVDSIEKVTKSIYEPPGTNYSDALRALLKNLLSAEPDARCAATEIGAFYENAKNE